MKQKLIEHVEKLIREHQQNEYCTDWEEVQNELDPDRAGFIGYDCGRYETLINLLADLENMEG